MSKKRKGPSGPLQREPRAGDTCFYCGKVIANPAKGAWNWYLRATVCAKCDKILSQKSPKID